MDKKNLLELKDLSVSVDGRHILHDINLYIQPGETQVIFGPNGGGKTTLLMALMGFPRYRVTKGKIIFKGKDITKLPLDERANLGIGLSFQRPPVVRGVKTRDIVEACLKSSGDGQTAEKLAQGPELALLDEPESGVDLENIALIGQLINDLLEKIHPIRMRTHSGLIISHTGHILDYVNARTGYVMCSGRIICEGDPHDILTTIKEKGYRECVSCPMK